MIGTEDAASAKSAVFTPRQRGIVFSLNSRNRDDISRLRHDIQKLDSGLINQTRLHKSLAKKQENDVVVDDRRFYLLATWNVLLTVFLFFGLLFPNQQQTSTEH
jgi:hypothetical protein